MINPASLITSIYQTAKAIYKQVKKVKANQAQCTLLSEPVRVVQQTIRDLEFVNDHRRYETALKETAGVLNDCLLFIQDFSNSNRWAVLLDLFALHQNLQDQPPEVKNKTPFTSKEAVREFVLFHIKNSQIKETIRAMPGSEKKIIEQEILEKEAFTQIPTAANMPREDLAQKNFSSEQQNLSTISSAIVSLDNAPSTKNSELAIISSIGLEKLGVFSGSPVSEKPASEENLEQPKKEAFNNSYEINIL